MTADWLDDYLACEHCGDTGRLLVERVVTLDELTPDEQPPYFAACHACQETV